MPFSRRRVSFASKNEFSRLPYEDELYVMNKFARHADKCDSCFDPWLAYKKGSTLCPEGHKRALEVAEYVYMRGDRSFSHLDEGQKHCVQIEIPADCEATRLLLKAMDRGLRVMRNKAPASYDKTYYVPARLSVPDNHRSMPASRPSTSYTTSQPAVPTTPKMAPAGMAPPKMAPHVIPVQMGPAKMVPQTTSSRTTPLKPLSPKAAPPQETMIAPQRRSQVKSRSRSSSTSSTSSTDSSRSRSRSRSTSRSAPAPTRSSRPYFVRSRSKDGKRSNSPVFIRTSSSKTAPQASTKDLSRSTSGPSHSRESSTSSTSSRRSSGLFSWGSSRSSSRNSSISSQDSLVERTAAPASPSKSAHAKSMPPVAFRNPKYHQDAVYQKIAPKMAVSSPPESPTRRAQVQPRSVR